MQPPQAPRMAQHMESGTGSGGEGGGSKTGSGGEGGGSEKGVHYPADDAVERQRKASFAFKKGWLEQGRKLRKFGSVMKAAVSLEEDLILPGRVREYLCHGTLPPSKKLQLVHKHDSQLGQSVRVYRTRTGQAIRKKSLGKVAQALGLREGDNLCIKPLAKRWWWTRGRTRLPSCRVWTEPPATRVRSRTGAPEPTGAAARQGGRPAARKEASEEGHLNPQWVGSRYWRQEIPGRRWVRTPAFGDTSGKFSMPKGVRQGSNRAGPEQQQAAGHGARGAPGVGARKPTSAIDIVRDQQQPTKRRIERPSATAAAAGTKRKRGANGQQETHHQQDAEQQQQQQHRQQQQQEEKLSPDAVLVELQPQLGVSARLLSNPELGFAGLPRDRQRGGGVRPGLQGEVPALRVTARAGGERHATTAAASPRNRPTPGHGGSARDAPHEHRSSHQAATSRRGAGRQQQHGRDGGEAASLLHPHLRPPGSNQPRSSPGELARRQADHRPAAVPDRHSYDHGYDRYQPARDPYSQPGTPAERDGHARYVTQGADGRAPRYSTAGATATAASDAPRAGYDSARSRPAYSPVRGSRRSMDSRGGSVAERGARHGEGGRGMPGYPQQAQRGAPLYSKRRELSSSPAPPPYPKRMAAGPYADPYYDPPQRPQQGYSDDGYPPRYDAAPAAAAYHHHRSEGPPLDGRYRPAAGGGRSRSAALLQPDYYVGGGGGGGRYDEPRRGRVPPPRFDERGYELEPRGPPKGGYARRGLSPAPRGGHGSRGAPPSRQDGGGSRPSRADYQPTRGAYRPRGPPGKCPPSWLPLGPWPERLDVAELESQRAGGRGGPRPQHPQHGAPALRAPREGYGGPAGGGGSSGYGDRRLPDRGPGAEGRGYNGYRGGAPPGGRDPNRDGGGIGGGGRAPPGPGSGLVDDRFARQVPLCLGGLWDPRYGHPLPPPRHRDDLPPHAHRYAAVPAGLAPSPVGAPLTPHLLAPLGMLSAAPTVVLQQAAAPAGALLPAGMQQGVPLQQAQQRQAVFGQVAAAPLVLPAAAAGGGLSGGRSPPMVRTEARAALHHSSRSARWPEGLAERSDLHAEYQPEALKSITVIRPDRPQGVPLMMLLK
ncbi:hypothetical protein N2152v2_001133 [Parachlorella kessleri]